MSDITATTSTANMPTQRWPCCDKDARLSPGRALAPTRCTVQPGGVALLQRERHRLVRAKGRLHGAAPLPCLAHLTLPLAARITGAQRGKGEDLLPWHGPCMSAFGFRSASG